MLINSNKRNKERPTVQKNLNSAWFRFSVVLISLPAGYVYTCMHVRAASLPEPFWLLVSRRGVHSIRSPPPKGLLMFVSSPSHLFSFSPPSFFVFVTMVVLPQELLDTTMAHLEAFALEGLRTLMVGSKEMTEEDFEEWEEVKNATILIEI